MNPDPRFVQFREIYYRPMVTAGVPRSRQYMYDNRLRRFCYLCDEELSPAENNRMGHQYRNQALDHADGPVLVVCMSCRGVQSVPPAPEVYECKDCGVFLSRSWGDMISGSQAGRPRNARRCRNCVGDPTAMPREEATQVSLGRRQVWVQEQPDPEEFERTCPCSGQAWSGGHVCDAILDPMEVVCDFCMPCTDDRCVTDVQRVGPMGVEWASTGDHCICVCPLED